MKITFTAYGNIQLAGENGLETYEFQAGDTATLRQDIATLFINQGIAKPVTSDRATKSKGETADK